jgi:hypothetical protein
LNLQKENDVKRNMDLIRALLLKLEAMDLPVGSVSHFHSHDEEVQIEGYTPDEIEYHAKLLTEAGLIEPGRGAMEGFMFRSLTWAGHDFADSVRNSDIWEKTKKGAAAAGGFTFDLLIDLAKGFVKKQIEDRTGVKL